MVTISILGIIATVTIPSIYRNFEERVIISQLKVAYHILDEALHTMYIAEGDPYKWDWPVQKSRQAANELYYMEKLAKYLPTDKFCNTANDRSCAPYGYYCNGQTNCTRRSGAICLRNNTPCVLMTLSGRNGTYGFSGSAKFPGVIRLKNNMVIAMSTDEIFTNQNVIAKYGIGVILVDVNGSKGQNRLGYDIFAFDVDNKGIVTKKSSKVTYGNTHGYVFNKDLCYKDATNNWNLGYSCSTWVMRHENMDYKRKDIRSLWEW